MIAEKLLLLWGENYEARWVNTQFRNAHSSPSTLFPLRNKMPESAREGQILLFLSLLGGALPVQQFQSFLVHPPVAAGYDLSW